MRKPLCTPLLASLLLALAGVGAHAQAVYRIVGPDGKVTFSDRAPDTAAKPAQSTTSGTGATGAALPYELQQVATRFPVTLYTGTDCTPCNNARNLLVGRGIPFTERTTTTNEDTPLVAVKAAQPAAPTAPENRAPAERQRPAPATDGPTPSNPAGIRF